MCTYGKPLVAISKVLRGAVRPSTSTCRSKEAAQHTTLEVCSLTALRRAEGPQSPGATPEHLALESNVYINILGSGDDKHEGCDQSPLAPQKRRFLSCGSRSRGVCDSAFVFTGEIES